LTSSIITHNHGEKHIPHWKKRIFYQKKNQQNEKLLSQATRQHISAVKKILKKFLLEGL
jgi:hypothetical protein